MENLCDWCERAAIVRRVSLAEETVAACAAHFEAYSMMRTRERYLNRRERERRYMAANAD